MALFTKIFGSNTREINKLQPIVDKINSFGPAIGKLSDEELKNKTTEFKELIKNGKTLDEILPEAFAVVREAADRVINERHFDTQLIGGIVLHSGKIAEMKTGGKNFDFHFADLSERFDRQRRACGDRQ